MYDANATTAMVRAEAVPIADSNGLYEISLGVAETKARACGQFFRSLRRFPVLFLAGLSICLAIVALILSTRRRVSPPIAITPRPTQERLLWFLEDNEKIDVQLDALRGALHCALSSKRTLVIPPSLAKLVDVRELRRYTDITTVEELASTGVACKAVVVEEKEVKKDEFERVYGNQFLLRRIAAREKKELNDARCVDISACDTPFRESNQAPLHIVQPSVDVRVLAKAIVRQADGEYDAVHIRNVSSVEKVLAKLTEEPSVDLFVTGSRVRAVRRAIQGFRPQSKVFIAANARLTRPMRWARRNRNARVLAERDVARNARVFVGILNNSHSRHISELRKVDNSSVIYV